MRLLYYCALYLAVVLPGFAQTTASAGPGLPNDPREILAAAAPFYDFTSPELKPWHLKASYQLYDEKGKPNEQGTYEYWWAAPKVYRSTWTRPGVTHTEWHTADGFAHQETGEQLGYFEEKLDSDFLSPLPSKILLDLSKSRLDRETISLGKVKVPCVMVIPLRVEGPKTENLPLGSSPTYCFDPQLPALLLTYDYSAVTTEFKHIVKVQNRYLARDIHVYYGKRELLSATVDAITSLDLSDPALTPSKDAIVVKFDKLQITSGVMNGMLLKKPAPIYPQIAKDARVSGTVLLQATIGKDGKIHDLRVILSASPLLIDSAKEAVSHWEYKPYLLNGEPVEVETTVNVIYTLGR
ncbi:MAG: energy transducer TonB [Terracidiphilus sp.]|jgi:TonB family protein